MRLFCFPYAGGSASTYARWPGLLPADVELNAIELPGHATRIREPLWTAGIGDLVQELTSALEARNDVPFVFFGHSMGALVAFLCARALETRGARRPEHLFVSARTAAHARTRYGAWSTLDDRALTESLRRGGGMAQQLLDEPDVMALLLPIIRSDFALLDSFVYADGPALSCPITACGGDADERVKPADLEAWRVHTTSTFDVVVFSGGHFYIEPCRDQVVALVARTLERRS